MKLFRATIPDIREPVCHSRRSRDRDPSLAHLLSNEDEYNAAECDAAHVSCSMGVRPSRAQTRKHGWKAMNRNVWKLTLAYDGTLFHGWQIQPGVRTIQGILADAIAAVTGERVLPQGAGRTDAGVHAMGQVASFRLAAPIPAGNFQRALNRVLSSAVRVVKTEQVSSDFHARHSSTGKIYQYRIFEGPVCSPFLAPYVARSRWALDLNAMQCAAQEILGEHDFTSFAASDPDRAARLSDIVEAPREPDNSRTAPSVPVSNIRRINASQWECVRLPSSVGPCGPFDLPDISSASANTFEGQISELSDDATVSDTPEAQAQIFIYTICGNGFLHHMVRNLVGTFLEIGRGRLGPGDITRILNARNRTLAGPTAPASGLCLAKVLY